MNRDYKNVNLLTSFVILRYKNCVAAMIRECLHCWVTIITKVIQMKTAKNV